MTSESGTTTMQVAKTKEAVVIDEILFPRNYYEVLTSLAHLMGQTPQEYITEALQCDIKMTLEDHDRLGELVVRPWKEMLEQ